MENPKIEIAWDTVVEELHGDFGLDAITVKNVKTDKISKIECEGYFVALGHTPNTKVFADAGIAVDEQGYVKFESDKTETNIKGIFVAGDCSDRDYKQAIVAAGMGAKAAIDTEKYLETI